MERTRLGARRWVALAVVLAIGLLGVAAPGPGQGAGAQAGEVAVAIVDFAFEPGTVEVPVGTTVVFTNQGQAPHTVTSDTGVFDSGRLDNGGTFSWTFDVPGTYTFFCAFHPNMQGTIVVGGDQAAPTEAPVAPTEGADVPTGDGPTPVEVPHLAHIHAGTCEELGIVVFSLSDPRSYVFPAAGGGEVQVLSATARVDLPELFTEPFSLHVHQSEVDKQVYVACAEIGAQPPDPWQPADGLALTLSEQQASGKSGLATLRADSGGATAVTLVLAGAAAGGGTAGGVDVTPVVTGPRPSTYTSPTFGYTLSYGSQWTVDEESSNGRQDRLVLINGTSFVTFVAAQGFGGDPKQCVSGFAEEQLVDPAVDNVTLATDADGNPLQGGTEATGAFAAYNHTYAFADGSVEQFTLFIGCIPLVAGESVLAVIQNVPTADYNAQVEAREGLLRGLTLPQQ